jgi:hypothetical protein
LWKFGVSGLLRTMTIEIAASVRVEERAEACKLEEGNDLRGGKISRSGNPQEFF